MAPPSLPLSHFLSLPRPGFLESPAEGMVDTTTVAAHNFDVDTRTGFMPPSSRLPHDWDAWERMLEDVVTRRLRLGSKVDLTERERSESEDWIPCVREVSHYFDFSFSRFVRVHVRHLWEESMAITRRGAMH